MQSAYVALLAGRTGWLKADHWHVWLVLYMFVLTSKPAVRLLVQGRAAALAAVQTNGAGVKAWLEQSARHSNRIDQAKTNAQPLVNTHVPGFDFDQLQGDGLAHVIEVSKNVGQRTVSLTFESKPVTPEQPFVVVTNNYRASGGGHFPGLDGSNIVLTAPDGTRKILAKWLERRKRIGAKDIEPTSWKFAPLKTRGPVVFTDASGKQDVARTTGLDHIRRLKDHSDGTATYAIELSR